MKSGRRPADTLGTEVRGIPLHLANSNHEVIEFPGAGETQTLGKVIVIENVRMEEYPRTGATVFHRIVVVVLGYVSAGNELYHLVAL